MIQSSNNARLKALKENNLNNLEIQYESLMDSDNSILLGKYLLAFK